MLSGGAVLEDKRRAINREWRISERDLVLLGALGGWPAGLVAMEACRHKTRKLSFQYQYSAAVLGNLLLIFLLGKRLSMIRIR